MAVSGSKEFDIKAAPADVMAAIVAVDRLGVWEGDEKVTWTLVESSQQKQQDGSYALTPNADGGTHIVFDLIVDPKIPVPGFLVKRAQKTALETASKGLTKFVEAQ